VNAKGQPDAYNLRTGNGLSDHLPLLLHLHLTQPPPASGPSPTASARPQPPAVPARPPVVS
jgi:hypothetical protein